MSSISIDLGGSTNEHGQHHHHHSHRSESPSLSSGGGGTTNTRKQMTTAISYLCFKDPFARLVGINALFRFFLFLYAFFLSSSMDLLVLTAFSYRAFYDFVVSFSAVVSVCLEAGVVHFVDPNQKEKERKRGEKKRGRGGGGRFLVLLNFSNCALALFTSTFIIFELIEWVFSLHHGPPDHSDSIYLGQVGLLSLFLSFVASGMRVQEVVGGYQHQLFTMSLSNQVGSSPSSSPSGSVGGISSSSPSSSPSPSPSSSSSAKSGATAQKFLQDNLPSLLLIVASWLLSVRWVPGDPLCAVVLSLSSIGTAYPLAESTGKALLLATPPHLSTALHTCVYEASTCEGVLEVYNYHFWTNSPGAFAGSLCVRVRSSADQQEVRTRISNIFSHLLSSLTIQIEKNEWEFASQKKEKEREREREQPLAPSPLSHDSDLYAHSLSSSLSSPPHPPPSSLSSPSPSLAPPPPSSSSLSSTPSPSLSHLHSHSLSPPPLSSSSSLSPSPSLSSSSSSSSSQQSSFSSSSSLPSPSPSAFPSSSVHDETMVELSVI